MRLLLPHGIITPAKCPLHRMSQARVWAVVAEFHQTVHLVAEPEAEKNLNASERFSPRKKTSSPIRSEKELFQNHGSRDVVLGPAAPASPGNLAEMQNL